MPPQTKRRCSVGLERRRRFKAASQYVPQRVAGNGHQNSGWIKPGALHSRLRVAFLPIKSRTACRAVGPPPQGLRRDKLCRRREEGRTHLLIHLPIEANEHRWCLWRPDLAGFDSRSIFEGALVEEWKKRFLTPSLSSDICCNTRANSVFTQNRTNFRSSDFRSSRQSVQGESSLSRFSSNPPGVGQRDCG